MCNIVLAQSLVLYPVSQSCKIGYEISVLSVSFFERLDRETVGYCELNVRDLIAHLMSC
jgi:hypothetical protein